MSGAAKLDGFLLAELVRGGAENLSANAETVNGLNVFPIPDGDTGDNMLLTMQGGVRAAGAGEADLAAVSRRIAQGMLLGARGNSGVILSQFCEGLAAAKTLDWARHEAVILVRGAEGSAEESERIAAALRTLRRGLEVYPVDGGQDIYSYILIAE